MKYADLEGLNKEEQRLPINENTDTELKTYESNNTEGDTKAVEKYTIIDILKNPELRIDTFILWYAWYVYESLHFQKPP